jgi:hypothetical protein
MLQSFGCYWEAKPAMKFEIARLRLMQTRPSRVEGAEGALVLPGFVGFGHGGPGFVGFGHGGPGFGGFDGALKNKKRAEFVC